MSETDTGARDAPLGARLAPLIAVTLALLSQVAMRDRIVLGPLFLAPSVEVLLATALILADTALGAKRHTVSLLRYALAVALVLTGTASAALLIADVLGARTVSVQQLLAEGVQIFVIIGVGFALLFWQLDRGGPNGRVQPDAERISFWFTQDAIREYSDEFDNWQPRFLDYLYLSATNLIAFSPTDTMPLTRTAKMLMLWESTVSLATFAVVLARAINILN